jgi:hypothetical protein
MTNKKLKKTIKKKEKLQDQQKARKVAKSQKEQEKLKICTPPESTPPNTLNASSPP